MSSSDECEQVQIGPHVTLITNDVMHNTLRGDLILADLQELLQIVERVRAQRGMIFLLTDTRQLGTIEPAARQYGVKWARTHTVEGSAIYGAGLMARALITLIERAITLVRAHHAPTVFFATEAQARAWIDAQRQKLYGKSSQK